MGKHIHITYFKVLILLMLLVGRNVFAQKIDLETYKTKYPGETKVILKNNTDFVVKWDNNKPEIYVSKYEEALCLSEDVVNESNESVTYSSFFELKNLMAKTLFPHKSKYQTINVTEFDTSDYRSPSVFYDDIKKISFKFPKLIPGAKTQFAYTYLLTEPRFVSPVFLNYFLPVEQTEISVTFPDNVEMAYKQFNCDSLKLNFTEEKKGNTITYKWTINNLPKIKGESGTPELAYYTPHIFVYIKNYWLNGVKKEVGNNPGDLFNWYQNYINPVLEKPSPTLNLLVDSLTNGVTSETEKVKKLFFWVQDNIKYIAFEAGDDGFIPREPELVFKRRYGDCKDMASITSRMLTLAGIPAYFVWLGTRHLPYSYYDLPLPACDNHMIAAYKSGGKWIFLDATTGNHPFGYPSDMIQGKEALIHLGPNAYEIAKIPEVPSELNSICDTVKIQLNGKLVSGTGICYFKGYSRFDMYNRVINKDKTSLTSFFKNYFEKGSNKFLITDFKIENLDNRDKDLIIKYQFTIADYVQMAGNELFINLNLDKPGLGDPIRDDRKYPIEADFKKATTHVVILDLPQGYKTSYIPENSEFKHEMFGYSITYKTENNKIILDHSFTTNFLLLQKNAFPQWNSMLEKVQSSYKETVNLTK